MNKARRKQIEEAIEALSVIKEMIENITADEQEYFDNMPEGIQGSEKGEISEGYISNLESAFESIESAMDELTEATE